MAKKPKAIELVFKAQPMIVLLLEIMKKHSGMESDPFVQDIEKWLEDARDILNRKREK